MGLTVRNMCDIVHRLYPPAIIGVQGFVNGDPYDTVALYVYPDDDDYWGEKEVVQVDTETDERLNLVSVTLSVNMDGRTRKKGKKMKNKTDDKEPLKLLTELSYIKGDEGDDVWLEIRLETRSEHGSRYMFVEGFAEALKSEPSMFENYYVDRILYEEPEDGERHLLILAVKEE